MIAPNFAVLSAVLLTRLAVCQTAAEPPSFDVADAKVSKTAGQLSGDFYPGGRLSLRNITMKLLIAAAWQVEPNAVTGGPNWLGVDQFDVIAKAPPQTTLESLHLMLRSLLAERFKLEVHQEEKVMPAFALKVGKGFKGQPADASEPTKCEGRREGGYAYRSCHNMSMAGLASSLKAMAPHYIDIPVVDLTGIKGRYDFTLRWTPQQVIDARQKGGVSIPGSAADISIFEAVEVQLGLKLERRKQSAPIVVVDRVERTPTDN